jgi:hypothetical protein
MSAKDRLLPRLEHVRHSLTFTHALLPFSPIDLAKLPPGLADKVLELVREVERHNAAYDRRAQLFGVLFAAFLVIAAVAFVWLGHPYFAIAALVTEALGFATKIIQQRR